MVQGNREGGTDGPTEPGSLVQRMPPPSVPGPGSPPPTTWDSHHRPTRPISPSVCLEQSEQGHRDKERWLRPHPAREYANFPGCLAQRDWPSDVSSELRGQLFLPATFLLVIHVFLKRKK